MTRFPGVVDLRVSIFIFCSLIVFEALTGIPVFKSLQIPTSTSTICRESIRSKQVSLYKLLVSTSTSPQICSSRLVS
ncbi:hypothetical protein DFP72DRAFT_888012 [Ephemerocybe angulata]|uniref:Uncharacterized protein n=1 Tax=Ephemerocybe angulata TaxID=980116 RepID=A0A8H6I4Q3_9AGAR|nr:hypothetical protein DFP72DRAFT_888012 [Tulosesus angulatus]